MKIPKNLIILLVLIFVFSVVQLLKVVAADEPIKKIVELGNIFLFSFVYSAVFIVCSIQFFAVFTQEKHNHRYNP